MKNYRKKKPTEKRIDEWEENIRRNRLHRKLHHKWIDLFLQCANVIERNWNGIWHWCNNFLSFNFIFTHYKLHVNLLIEENELSTQTWILFHSISLLTKTWKINKTYSSNWQIYNLCVNVLFVLNLTILLDLFSLLRLSSLRKSLQSIYTFL